MKIKEFEFSIRESGRSLWDLDSSSFHYRLYCYLWLLSCMRLISGWYSISFKEVYMLRACCVNHRSRREDFECLVDKIKEIATKLRQ